MTTIVKEVVDVLASAGIAKDKAEDIAVSLDEYYIRRNASELVVKNDLVPILEGQAELRGMIKIIAGVVIGTFLAVIAIYLK